MKNRTDPLINRLANELEPIRPLRLRHGRNLLLAGLAATVVVAAVLLGRVAPPPVDFTAPLFIITNGLLLLLGLAAGFTVVSMALPRVGSGHDVPKWAMASVALLPLAAIGAVLTGYAGPWSKLMQDHDLACFALGSLFAILTAFSLLFWLRRGAPVSPPRAGLLLGIAAGALGSFANGLFCPIQTIWHLGIWHVLPIVLWAIIGRFALAPLLRW